jgi:hypothetical protein
MLDDIIDIVKLHQCFEEQRYSAEVKAIPAISYRLPKVLPEGRQEIAPGLYADIDNTWLNVPSASQGSFAWILLDDAEHWLKQQKGQQ